MNSYLRQAFEELFAEDGLVVIARGLGMQSLFCKFAQYYGTKSTKNERKLVFCLNCTGAEDSLKDLFTSSGNDFSDLPQVALLFCQN